MPLKFTPLGVYPATLSFASYKKLINWIISTFIAQLIWLSDSIKFITETKTTTEEKTCNCLLSYNTQHCSPRSPVLIISNLQTPTVLQKISKHISALQKLKKSSFRFTERYMSRTPFVNLPETHTIPSLICSFPSKFNLVFVCVFRIWSLCILMKYKIWRRDLDRYG